MCQPVTLAQIESLKEEIKEMERIFCEDSNREGGKGWAKYFQEDGIMLTKSTVPIVGREEIEKAMEQTFNIPGMDFKWWPIGVEVSPDGFLGVAHGIYNRSYVDKNGEKVEDKGMYTTVWKRQEDHSWKIVWDGGN